jgi:hypothetical protein
MRSARRRLEPDGVRELGDAAAGVEVPDTREAAELGERVE